MSGSNEEAKSFKAADDIRDAMYLLAQAVLTECTNSASINLIHDAMQRLYIQNRSSSPYLPMRIVDESANYEPRRFRLLAPRSHEQVLR
ncbi:MAG: hypothetical protein ACRYF5_18635, partial [Janthinobacterium lividum]